VQETSREQTDQALETLQANKDSWAGLPIPARLEILAELVRDMRAVAGPWVSACLSAKGLPAGGMGEAEEWLFFATILRALRMVRQTLAEIHLYGRPRWPGRVVSDEAGLASVRVFPRDPWDPVVYRGMSAEVRMDPTVAEGELEDKGSWVYPPPSGGKVALVLGAGNASMLPVVDLLHKLFVENQVVVLKPNPVNAYLGPLIEAGLAALVRRGYLRIVYGGVEQGSYLCEHPSVDELHLTGSARTFEAITFGPGAAGQRRKASRRPLNPRPFTAELGNISPVIVVPGPWSAVDLQDQAEQLVTWFVANAGFGCLTPRMLIQHAGWEGRRRFLEAVEKLLEGVETRPAYYPGAAGTHREFLAAHPSARLIGQAQGGNLPWTVIPGLDPSAREEICFTREAFCSLLGETALEAATPAGFLRQAVEFANQALWGSLVVTLLVHPVSQRDPEIAGALEQAVARLRYGTVTVNMAAFSSYYFQVAPWGAYPGHASDDIHSGKGKTANFLLLPRPQKSIVRGPFRKFPDPLRVTARGAARFARELASFEGDPSFIQIPGLMRRAFSF
jgi:acyl-CoA reductase-like NAD-dependent aldehyde dehydrogenase